MKKNNGAFYHALASNIKYILAAVVEDQRNFKVVIKSFAKQENIDIESKDEIGFMDARDVFMIALNCNDCNKLKENIKLIMKVIKKEEKTFDNIVTVLNDFVDKNENNCKTFLNFEEIQEICSFCEDISDIENDN